MRLAFRSVRERVITLAVVAVVLAGVAGLGWGLLGKYRSWKVGKMVGQAGELLAKGDFRGAVLSAQSAVSTDPSRADACRIMADLSELAGAPVTHYYRERVAAIEPEVLTNHLAAVNTALKLGETELALRSLGGFRPAQRNSWEFHRAAAAVALSTNGWLEAVNHSRAVVVAKPGDAVARLNLAALLLQSTNNVEQSAARVELQALRGTAAVRQMAGRHLLLDLARQGEHEKALALAVELEKDPDSVFGDRILRLRTLRTARPLEWQSALKEQQAFAGTNFLHVTELARWMQNIGEFARTVSWLEQLPAGLTEQMPLPVVLAECRASLGQWAAVDAGVAKQNWGELEFARHLTLARSFRERGNETAAGAAWRKALGAATSRPERLAHLVKVTGSWGWKKELGEALWGVFEKDPRQTWAFIALNDRLHGSGDTAGLQRLYARRLEILPEDVASRNNLALTHLLLSPGDPRGHALAKEVYSNHPENPYFLSTYAFSLHLSKRTAEAVTMIKTLKEEQLKAPSVSVYAGLLLAAGGERQAAKAFLTTTDQSRLLPQERTLVKQALVAAR